MPNSYIGMGILAVVCIILSLKWVRNSGRKEKLYRDIKDSKEWAKKWNEARAKDSSRWCMDECLHCEENDWCKFSEVHYDNN